MTAATGPCGSCPCSGAVMPQQCCARSPNARRPILRHSSVCWASIARDRCKLPDSSSRGQICKWQLALYHLSRWPLYCIESPALCTRRMALGPAQIAFMWVISFKVLSWLHGGVREWYLWSKRETTSQTGWCCQSCIWKFSNVMIRLMMMNWALSFSQNGDKCFFSLARVSFFCAAFILHLAALWKIYIRMFIVFSFTRATTNRHLTTSANVFSHSCKIYMNHFSLLFKGKGKVHMYFIL